LKDGEQLRGENQADTYTLKWPEYPMFHAMNGKVPFLVNLKQNLLFLLNDETINRNGGIQGKAQNERKTEKSEKSFP
jgi:hypothetical protein